MRGVKKISVQEISIVESQKHPAIVCGKTDRLPPPLCPARCSGNPFIFPYLFRGYKGRRAWELFYSFTDYGLGTLVDADIYLSKYATFNFYNKCYRKVICSTYCSSRVNP